MSILPFVLKVYERVEAYQQASNYFKPFFNEIFCGFRKAHSTQYALFLNYQLIIGIFVK